MKVLVCQLIYGNRPLHTLLENEKKAGYPGYYCQVNTEGISNALNEGIDYMMKNGYDFIAFQSNDIIEPENWLAKKLEAIQTYPDAGAVASSLHEPVTKINNEFIISNWLMSRHVIQKVGYFNESMFPYGPIDLDYCERIWAAGMKTYYVMDCHAYHVGEGDSRSMYGWDKNELLNKYSQFYKDSVAGYRDGTIPYYLPKIGDNGKA